MSLSLTQRLFAGTAVALIVIGLTYAALASQGASANHVPAASYSGTAMGSAGSAGSVSIEFSTDGTMLSPFSIEFAPGTDQCIGVQPPWEFNLAMGPAPGHPFAGTLFRQIGSGNWEVFIDGSFSTGGNASGTWRIELNTNACIASGTWSATILNTDGDGCFDFQEDGLDEELGGRRDPNNPYDFYDTNGDGTIDLFIDIFNVADAFGDDADSVGPGEPDGYDASLDRSAPLMGDDPWDMQAPDGLIDLFTDIFGVAYQFGHTCA